MHKCDDTNRMLDPGNLNPEARKREECPTLKIAGADGVTPLAKFGPYFRPDSTIPWHLETLCIDWLAKGVRSTELYEESC